MRWRNREQTVKYKFYLKQEACLWIWNTLKHSPNFRCPSKHMSFLKCFLSSGEWSFPSLSESLSCSSLWSLIWKPFCFRSTRFYLKEVLAEMIELFWEKKETLFPPLSQLLIFLAEVELLYSLDLPPSWALLRPLEESQYCQWKWVFLARAPTGFPLRRQGRGLWKMSNCPEAKLVLSQQWQNHCQMSKG